MDREIIPQDYTPSEVEPVPPYVGFDRQYPALGWRNFLAALVSIALVWAVVWWVIA